MKKIIFIAICILAAVACGSSIKYKVAEHYFFRNDAVVPENPIITTQAELDSLFGMAPVMGGLPTSIDFSKEFVLAIVLPETNRPTTIVPKVLSSEGDTLIMTYSLDVDPESTFTMVPCCLLIIDRQYLKPKAILKRTSML